MNNKMKKIFGIILSLVLVLVQMSWTSLTVYAIEPDLTMDDLVRAVGTSEFTGTLGTTYYIYVNNGELEQKLIDTQGYTNIFSPTGLQYYATVNTYSISFNNGPDYLLEFDSENYITAFYVSGGQQRLTGRSQYAFEKTPSPSGGGDSSSDTSSITSTAVSHTHSYAWEDVKEATEDDNGEIIYKCSCGEVLYRVPTSAYNVFNRNTTEKIKNAKQGATVKIETSRWISFHKMVMQALADRPDVSLEVSFLDGEYKGNRVSFTIPAGTDTLSLLDENGFSGFLYLAGKFGTTN